MDMYLAGVVPGENVGAIAEKVGDAGWLRFGKVVLGVGIEVVAVVVVVMVVGVDGTVVVADAELLGVVLWRRPKRFRRCSRSLANCWSRREGCWGVFVCGVVGFVVLVVGVVVVVVVFLGAGVSDCGLVVEAGVGCGVFMRRRPFSRFRR